ncbi:MAG: PAS domain S-box protein [Balneolales bacterium]
MPTIEKKYSQNSTKADLKKLVDDLQANKLRLETQNQDLRIKVKNKEHTLKKYAEHHDYAPVGYLSLDKYGIIKSINLTGCNLIGEERQNLIGNPVEKYLDQNSIPIVQRHLEDIFKTLKNGECRVKMNYKGISSIIEIRSIAVQDEDSGQVYCRCSMFNVTEKIQAESKLDEQHKLIEAVFENIVSVILVCNQQGQIILANQAAKNLFGPDIVGIKADQWPEFMKLYQEDEETLLSKEELPLFKACKGEYVKGVEVHFKPGAGQSHILLARGQPIVSQRGLKLGGVIILHDITSRKQNEDKLKEYQEQLEQLVEERTSELHDEITERTLLQKKYLNEKLYAESLISSHPGLFFLIDNQGYLHRWNKNMEVFSGYSNDEIKEMTALKLLDEQDIETTRFILDMAFKHGKAVGKARLITKKGDKIPFLLCGVSMKIAEQEFVLGSGIDITVSEKERSERMAFFQVLEKSINEIYMFDPTTFKFTYVNAGARKNLGYSHDELINMHSYEIKPEFTKAELLKIMQPLIRKEEDKITLRTKLKRKNGSTYPIELQLQLIEQEHEKVFIAIVWDITQRLDIEESMKKALKEKEVLLGEIHHRIKNNLAVVSSLLSIQAGHVRDPYIHGLFMESESRVRTMALIHEMLYQQENFSTVDFNPYINKLIKYISSNFHSDENIIRTNISIKDIYLEIGSAVPCALIINELLTNAYKYAFIGRREGNINVTLYHEKGMVTLIVHDDGIGLPGNIDIAQTLGMTLIKGLTNQLKGEMDIKNENGAKFSIRFPYIK